MNYDNFVAWLGESLKNKDGTILFETYGEDYDQVKAADPRCVWTVLLIGSITSLCQHHGAGLTIMSGLYMAIEALC